MTGSKSYPLVVMLLLLCVLSKTTKAQAQAVDIGDISELNGSAQIVRDKPYDANLKFAIQSNDEAITTNGRMAITFLDDSTNSSVTSCNPFNIFAGSAFSTSKYPFSL